MGFASFLILAFAAAWLWRRVDRLEAEVARLRADQNVPASRAEQALPARDGPFPADPPAIAAVDPAPVPPPTPPPTHRWRPTFDFEDLFGRMLPIWAGGVTLAVAGFFLVRWAIEAGLLTPPVRVFLAGMFGIALVAGAEAAFRWRDRVADPRVAQALAGAGLATLYAAFYLAGSTYGLIGPEIAFVGLAAVTAVAIGGSFRFGVPSAVLGLIGGFAAPALVGSEDANLPLLVLYLALVTGGLTVTGRRQDRAWLGIAALAGGLGWGALLVGQGAAASTPAIAMLGGYLVLLGAIIPALAGGEGGGRLLRWVQIAAAGLAALQLAVLVQQGGFGALEWGLYLMLGAALAWFAWREPAMREAYALAAAIGVLLLSFWAEPPAAGFAPVAAAIAAIFAGVPLARLVRGQGTPLEAGQAVFVPLGLALAVYGHFGIGDPAASQGLVAAALALVAVLPAAAAYGATRSALDVRWVWLAQSAAALIAYGALERVLPDAALAWTAALFAVAAAWRGGLAGAVAIFAAIAVAWALRPAGVWLGEGALALVGSPMELAEMPGLRAVALRLVPAALALAAWRLRDPPAADWLGRIVAAAAAAIALVAGHTVFRHIFAALAGTDFVATGVIERAAWQSLLVALGWLAMVRGHRVVAIGLAGMALAHFAIFSILLHNPLWSAQAVGPWPFVNALVPMAAPGFAGLWLAARLLPHTPRWPHWVLHAAAMALTALTAIALLRQVFAGSLLAIGPVGQTEDLLRSLTGIVLAAGFLAWGARTGGRSWRIGSLVLMVVAVLKVFLVDAAGLAGLARIASFMALGFSLIGIGWFYNRQLRAAPPADPAAAVT